MSSQRLSLARWFGNKEISFLVSCALHVMIFVWLITLSSASPPIESLSVVELDVIETPLLPPPPKPLVLPTHTSTKAKSTTKASSGVSRDSTTERASDEAPKVKLGNTLSKAPDKGDSTDEPLAPPAEEFEISRWPQLKNDVRVPYPKEAKAKGIEGSVVMDLYISESGVVKRATLVKGPGYGLDEAALEAAKQFLFSPAKVGDKVMPIVIRYSYNFVIQR